VSGSGGPERDFVERSLRYLDGSVQGEELRQFAQELSSSPARRQQFSSLLLDVTALCEIGAEEKALPRRLLSVDELSASALDGSVPGRGFMRSGSGARLVLWSSVAMAALVVIGVAVRRNQHGGSGRIAQDPVATSAGPTPVEDYVPRDSATQRAHASAARVEKTRGEVRALRGGALVELGSGAWVGTDEGVQTVGAQSQARLRLSGGSLLDLHGDTAIAALGDAGSVVLERGALDVRIAGPALEVQTSTASASGGAGTRFVFSLASGVSRIDVRNGRTVIHDRIRGSSVGVDVGHFATLARSSALVVSTSPRVAVLIVGSLPKSDSLYEEHLAARGFRVVRVVDADLDARDVEEVALIVVSPSVIAAALDPAVLRDLPIPIINSEPLLHAGLGMGHPLRPGEQGFIKGLTAVEITAPGHPMAAGLAGKVTVTTLPTLLAWGRPESTASVVAQLAGQADRPALFGYERGTLMVALTAPARRVGLFLHPASALVLTDAGWQLFDAAVQWATGDPPPGK
jgi:hypothetical protein